MLLCLCILVLLDVDDKRDLPITEMVGMFSTITVSSDFKPYPNLYVLNKPGTQIVVCVLYIEIENNFFSAECLNSQRAEVQMKMNILTIFCGPYAPMLSKIVSYTILLFAIRRPICSVFVNVRCRLQPQTLKIRVDAVN